MSALLLSALAAGSSGQGALYVDDVFSTHLYTGNGSTQTINNGIDLAGKGGLVWIKCRSNTYNNVVFSTANPSETLVTNLTGGTYGNPIGYAFSGFNSNGFGLDGSFGGSNGSSDTYASWTFRKAQKFFDVVTYTGNGVAGRQIPHSLGAQAGFVTVKATSATGDWNSYHRSATGDLKLNLTDAQTASRAIITAADANSFTVSGAANTNGVSYVAYLFAHDPSADGIIQCGSFTTDGSGNATVNLGWEPQWLLQKNRDNPPVGTTSSWWMVDSMRGIFAKPSTTSPVLEANLSAFEAPWGGDMSPIANGFSVGGLLASTTYIYLAIRRPNKPPTSGAQVYNAITRTGTGAAATVTGVGFAPDLVIAENRDGSQSAFFDRLRGVNKRLRPDSANVEASDTDTLTKLDIVDGFGVGGDSSNVGVNINGSRDVFQSFRRAPGFFDVVCDTGTGAAHAIAHNLTKAPELIIRKSRSAATQWEVWHSALAATEKLVLNSNAAKATDTAAWNSTAPTATQFTVGTGANVNANAATFVTYLFATLAGISKVGSYTGNGSSQTIDCGFSTGARFFLVKATSTTGSWWVYDSARGIVSAADPALQLNSTAAEITSADAVDPASVGIIVNQEATCSINATGVSYIFLAIA